MLHRDKLRYVLGILRAVRPEGKKNYSQKLSLGWETHRLNWIAHIFRWALHELPCYDEAQLIENAFRI